MRRLTLLGGLLFIAGTLCAQEKHDPPKDAKEEEKFPAPPAEEKSVKTAHVLRIDGHDLHYTAVAGTLLLKKENEKPKASIFYVAYTLDGADPAKRPVTFAFNGGPGSSSVWLHLGALGPRRVQLTTEGMPVAPPYHLVDNTQSALTFTDLVFIDPVTTGFSRNAPGEDPKQFHGVQGDLDSVASFIHSFLSKSQRWDSPKFLAGESYGTTRAAGLSRELLQEHGIYLNGITLISSALDFQTLDFGNGNEMPYIGFLPSYTATAWYHKKLPADLQGGTLEQAVAASRAFAGGDYARALFKGDELQGPERTAIVNQLARFTGLSAEYIEESNLRIQDQRFMKELMRKEHTTLGRYDSRLEGTDLDQAAEGPEYDPSYAAVQGAFTAALNDYVRRELNWQTDIPYAVLTGKVQPWDFSEFTGTYVNVRSRLASALTQNQFMRVLQMNGYYDLATPFFATEYALNHLALPAKLHQNITSSYCDAGHMLYLRESCLEKLHGSMNEMYGQALASH